MNRPEKETFFHLAFLEMSFGRKEVVNRFDTDGYVKALNDYIDQLEKALNKACDKLQKSDLGNTCDKEYRKQCRENHCFRTCIHSRPLTIEEWKEWCMKDETIYRK